jgi:hypothetical protein
MYVWFFFNLKIQILEMFSNGETHNMKVVYLKKLWNFVFGNFFIWSRLQ